MSPIGISKTVLSLFLSSALIFAISNVAYALIVKKDFFEIVSQASVSCGIILPFTFLMSLLIGIYYYLKKTNKEGFPLLLQIPKVEECTSESRQVSVPEVVGKEVVQKEIHSASIQKELTSEEIAKLPWLTPISLHDEISEHRLNKDYPVPVLYRRTKKMYYPSIDFKKDGLSIILLDSTFSPYILTEIYKDGTIKRYEHIYDDNKFIPCREKISLDDINSQLRLMRINFPDFIPKDIFWIAEPGTIVIRTQERLTNQEHYFFGSKERDMTRIEQVYLCGRRSDNSGYYALRDGHSIDIAFTMINSNRSNEKIYISGILAERKFVNDADLRAEIIETLNKNISSSVIEELSNHSPDKELKRSLSPPGIFDRSEGNLSLVVQYLVPNEFFN